MSNTAEKIFNRNNFPISRNFRGTEVECHGEDCCGNVAKADGRCIDMLQGARDELGRPVTVNSFYRCKSHNHKVGGAPRSRHMEGMAVDVPIEGTGLTVRQLADLLIKHGAVRVVLYLTLEFVHAEPCDRRNDDGTMKTREMLVP